MAKRFPAIADTGEPEAAGPARRPGRTGLQGSSTRRPVQARCGPLGEPSLTPGQAESLRARAAAREAKAGLARDFGISRQTFYPYLSPPASASS